MHNTTDFSYTAIFEYTRTHAGSSRMGGNLVIGVRTQTKSSRRVDATHAISLLNQTCVSESSRDEKKEEETEEASAIESARKKRHGLSKSLCSPPTLGVLNYRRVPVKSRNSRGRTGTRRQAHSSDYSSTGSFAGEISAHSSNSSTVITIAITVSVYPRCDRNECFRRRDRSRREPPSRFIIQTLIRTQYVICIVQPRVIIPMSSPRNFRSGSFLVS